MSTETQASAQKDRVVIFDTTLRDGEQSPGASMTLEEKLQVAELLDEMGVDIIEAGFPIASNGDFEAVSEIAKRVKRAVVCGLARASNADIDRAAEAVSHAERRRIHTFIGTSPLHRQFQLQLNTDQVHERGGQFGDAGAELYRRRRVVADGCDPHRARFPLPCGRDRDQVRGDDDQHPRHGRLRHAGRVPRPDQDAPRSRAQRRPGDLLDPLPQRPRAGGRQLARRRRSAGRGRSSARSTALASAPATRRSRRS